MPDKFFSRYSRKNSSNVLLSEKSETKQSHLTIEQLQSSQKPLLSVYNDADVLKDPPTVTRNSPNAVPKTNEGNPSPNEEHNKSKEVK